MMNGKANIKTIIVLVILVLVGVLSFLGVGAAQTYLSGAAAGSEPQSVLATPGEDGKSVQITWMTDKTAQAVVEYGTTPASLLLRSLESEAVTDHKMSISPLKPGTSYYFRIRVGDEIFDNSGIPYSFKTKGESVGGKQIAPTGPKTPSVMPTITTSGTCDKTTDFNGDGVVNSVDYIRCMQAGGKAGASPVTVAPVSTGSATECKSGVDYDGNGVINSIDRTKCLQKKI